MHLAHRELPLPVAVITEHFAGPVFHPPVFPGSTPELDGKRFLTMSTIGRIRYSVLPTTRTVEIEFCDKSRTGTRFSDPHGIRMAAMCASCPPPSSVVSHSCSSHVLLTAAAGAIFAGDSNGTNPATILFRAFDKWTPDCDWTSYLPPNEVSVAPPIVQASPLPRPLNPLCARALPGARRNRPRALLLLLCHQPPVRPRVHHRWRSVGSLLRAPRAGVRGGQRQ